jgi:hypothetical protein
MYDINFWKIGQHVTVGQLCSYLQKLPQDAIVTIDGDERFYTHLEKDKTLFTLDSTSLYDLEEYDGHEPTPFTEEDFSKE